MPKQLKRWVKIIFKSSMGEKTIPHVVQLYIKADCLVTELPDKDEDGNPILISYPLINIFSYARAHLPHVGASERKDGSNA